jgi:tetratricopeptide (TPR) repeat protein
MFVNKQQHRQIWAPLVFLSLLQLITTVPAWAKKTALRRDRSIHIIYQSPEWNADPKRIDTAFVIVRDSATGKLARINLEETEPDSGIFEGYFSVAFTDVDIQPQIFVPPQDMRNDPQTMSDFASKVSRGEIRRKPIILRPDSDSGQIFQIFDTPDQAQEAFRLYKADYEQTHSSSKPIVPAPSLETADMMKRRQQAEQMALETAEHEADRSQQEQKQRLARQAELLRTAKLSDQEQKRRQTEAKALADQAVAVYKNGQYPAAETLFQKALQLSPADNEYAYYYGVTLYRLGKFNEALVQIRISEDDPTNINEKRYYSGLIHYRLKELDPAQKDFQAVQDSGDKDLAPSASFYKGVLFMGLEQYDEAKKSFEFVLDNSKDPKMDDQAEQYIEQILQAQDAKKKAHQRLNLSATVGLMYDSNVLLASDYETSQGSATNKGGLRLFTTGTADYRIFTTGSHQLDFKINPTYLYSFQTVFHPADPLILNAGLPYVYKNMLFGKGYTLTIAPTFEALYMDPYDTGHTNDILSSGYINVNNLFVMRDNWFSYYIFEARRDISYLSESPGDNSYSAWKYTVSTNQVWFLDSTKKRALLANLGVVLNNAEGINRYYQRFDSGVNYTAPFTHWNASWLVGISAYYLTFPKGVPTRHDENLTFSAALNKPINNWVTLGLLGTYTTNGSDQSDYAYNKYTIMTTATFTTGL